MQLTKEKPILCNTPMIHALLAGRKTMTRRIIKPQPIIDLESGHVYDGNMKSIYALHSHIDWKERFVCDWSKIKEGDLLWVRENIYEEGYYYTSSFDESGEIETRWFSKGLTHFMADTEPENIFGTFRTKPSIHMPKSISRIWLKVVSVEIERVQDISTDDAISEGLEFDYSDVQQFKNYETGNFEVADPRDSFRSLWNKINGSESYANRWVWKITFKVLSVNGKPNELDT